MFAQEDLDRIRDGYPEILEHYGIKPTQDFRIPWRDDSKPSGHYSPESNLVTDFGPDERYNVFEFVGMKEDLTDFKDQVRIAASILGLQLGEASTPTRQKPKAKRPRFEPLAEAGFAEMPLLPFAWSMGKTLLRETEESGAALDYLHGRGFSDAKIFQNVLGFTPSMDCFVNDDGSPLFTLYEPTKTRGYVVIPYASDSTFSTVHYVVLRTIPGDEKPQHKEIRPTGCKSPLYREWLLSAGRSVVYVTEGPFDCLALELIIGKPCIALGGTGTKRLGQVLYSTPSEQRPRKVILALDNDDAGRKASATIARDLDALAIPHAVFEYPQGIKDANELLLQIGGER